VKLPHSNPRTRVRKKQGAETPAARIHPRTSGAPSSSVTQSIRRRYPPRGTDVLPHVQPRRRRRQCRHYHRHDHRRHGRGCVAVGGFRGWKGRGRSAVDSTPPGAAPKYPDPGQQGDDLSESQEDRIWSGAGIFPRGFPNPPTTCLNFSIWRDLSVWRIWGGYFRHWRSGWGGVY